MKVINLYGGPGTGKSRTAALLFSHLKDLGHNAELVREYAKRVVWEGRGAVLEDQLYMLAKQARHLKELERSVEVVVTDAPLLQFLIYQRPFEVLPAPSPLEDMIRYEFARFDNVNYFLRRSNPYNPAGRTQTEEEAKALDGKALTMLVESGTEFNVVGTSHHDVVMLSRDISQRHLGPTITWTTKARGSKQEP